eukprot:m.8418 g.8418  ORF g.8418 m.8418 type:complete len:768 (+) comp3229_c0_seq1:125-2428(+)
MDNSVMVPAPLWHKRLLRAIGNGDADAIGFALERRPGLRDFACGLQTTTAVAAAAVADSRSEALASDPSGHPGTPLHTAAPTPVSKHAGCGEPNDGSHGDASVATTPMTAEDDNVNSRANTRNTSGQATTAVALLFAKLGYKATSSLFTPLQYAAWRDSVGDTVAQLVALGCSPNYQGILQATPLHIAAKRGHLGAIRALAKAGCTFTAEDGLGRVPCEVAANRATLDLLMRLAVAGSDPGNKDSDDVDGEWVLLPEPTNMPAALPTASSSPRTVAGPHSAAAATAGIPIMGVPDCRHASSPKPMPRSESLPAQPRPTTATTTGTAEGSLLSPPFSSSSHRRPSLTRSRSDDGQRRSLPLDVGSVTTSHEWLVVETPAAQSLSRSLVTPPDSPLPSRSNSLDTSRSPHEDSVPFSPYRFGDVTRSLLRLLNRSSSMTSPPQCLSSSFVATTDPEEEPVTFGLIPFEELTVIKELGSGAFGQVFEADWNGVRLAAKVLNAKPGTANRSIGSEEDRDKRSSLLQEIRMFSLLSECNHANILSFIGACSFGKRVCLCTELARGGSLYDLIHREQHPFSHAIACRWAMEIACGLAYLHDKGILHRDLKSPNVLLADAAGCFAFDQPDESDLDIDGFHAKLGDFGEALLGMKQVTELERLAGSFRWMAPEVMREEWDSVAESIDIYSFGMVLFELLERKLPFHDYSEGAQIVFAVAACNCRPELSATQNKTARELFERCWHSDPSERPSARWLLHQLPRLEDDDVDMCMEPT